MKDKSTDQQLLATIKQKAVLRQEFKLKREQLNHQSIIDKSRLIEEKILNLATFHQAQNIMCYVSKDKEVFTHDLIKKILKMRKTVVVPYIVKKGIMKPAIIQHFSELSLAEFNTLQPQTKNFLDEKIELNLVPALAVSKNGDRLGWGAGFYDLFISDYQPQLNIALIFDCQLVDQLPTTKFDQKIDGVITESQYLLF